MARKLLLVAGGLVVGALLGAPAIAQTCTCDNSANSVCGGQGFEITLIDFAVDQMAGESHWDYKVCNDESLSGVCTPPKDLSHVDFNLPALGACLSAGQQMSFTQVGGFAAASLVCGISEKDPSCDLFGTPGADFVAKCDVAAGDVDPGECVVMRLSIAGEQPSLGAGAAMTVTKAGPGCATDCILGPSCEPCVVPPLEQCLTRTAGFWGTHPHVTQLFLPVTVCGEPLSVVEAGSCDSATEALCVSPGRESKGNQAYAQLVRQLTAAKLNLAATGSLGGYCNQGIEATVAGCEALCGANQKTISGSGCIEALAAFNESQDTYPVTPAPFDRPGPANPRECQAANGDGLLIGAGGCG